MANEFTCWNCKGDGTRCDCAWKKDPNRFNAAQMESVQERIDRNQREIDENLRLMSNTIYKVIDGKQQVTDNLNRNRWVFVGKDGWPVEGIMRRPVLTFIRRLLFTRKIETYSKWLRRTGQRIQF